MNLNQCRKTWRHHHVMTTSDVSVLQLSSIHIWHTLGGFWRSEAAVWTPGHSLQVFWTVCSESHSRHRLSWTDGQWTRGHSWQPARIPGRPWRILEKNICPFRKIVANNAERAWTYCQVESQLCLDLNLPECATLWSLGSNPTLCTASVRARKKLTTPLTRKHCG